MRKALPALAAVAAVGLVVLLVGSGDRSKAPDPEPDVTSTTTSTRPASVLLRWLVPRGTRAASVVDLERHHPVLQLSPVAPTDGGAGVFDQAFVADEPGRTVRFRASVRVSGPGRAGLFIRAIPMTAGPDQEVRDLATVVTPDASLATAGPWRRLSVELVLPKGTARLLYGVSLGGGGSVLVDDADEL